MNYYSFNRPRRDGWLSWPCWLTDSGRFTHKVVTRPAISLAQDRESSLARTGGLTTMHYAIILSTTLSHRWWLNVVVCRLAFFREVNRHWAWLLLRLVTVYKQVNHLGIWQATYVDSAFYPPWHGKMSISFWAG